MSETFELELDRRPFAQPSCQASGAADETCVCHFEARQASAERAGIDWLANLVYTNPKSALRSSYSKSSLGDLVYTANFALQRVFTSGATSATIWRQHSIAWQH